MSEDQTLILSDFAKVIDFNSLYQSYTEARKGKRWKYAVCKYEVNVLENLMFVHFMLSAHKYRLSPYNCFIVKEPKERLTMYNSFRDKIVQHSLCDNVLEPYLSKTFIYDNYASQKGKGTHFGLDRLKYFMSRYYRQNGADGWVLKCDIRKYFYSINHDVLKEQLRRLIKDRDVLWLLDMIIDSTKGPGIPIGNHTSQWFAVLYLSGMDHMIKERLGIKMYGRYMDDFYLIHPDKDYLRYCLEEIKKYLVPLGLELNQKTAIFPLTQGIDFLGFRTYLTDTGKVVRKVRRESKNRIQRKLKKYRHLLDEGRIDFETILQSYSSWTGHAEHGNSYHLIRKTDDLFFNLFKNELEGLTYAVGNIRQYNGELFRCVQAHTSQADWTPDATASLWKKIGDPTEEWPAWSQPIGAHDAYNSGDKVSHNGKHWTSNIDANVWEPGVYGWTEVTK